VKAAIRHLMRNRLRSILTLLAVMIPVYSLVIVFGLAEANLNDMFETATRVDTGHLQIREAKTKITGSATPLMRDPAEPLAILDKVEGIEWRTVRLDLPVLASAGERSQAVFLQGVVPEEIDPISAMRDRIVAGEYLTSTSKGVVIGEELANLLKVGVGDDIILLGVHPETGLGVLRVVVRGIYSSPIAEMGRAVVQAPLAVARQLARSTTAATAIVVRVAGVKGIRDAPLIDAVITRLDAMLPSEYEVLGWRELVPMAATYMRILKPILLVFAAIFFGLGALVVLNPVYLSVMERTRELGLIISLGASRWRVIRMILTEAGVLAVMGAASGGLAGVVFVWIIEAFGGIPLPAAFSDIMKGMGLSGSLHMMVSASQVIISAVAMAAVAILAAWVPARTAAKLEPVEAMLYVE